MPSPISSKKGGNMFERQGHTSGPYGQNPSVNAKGVADSEPKELKP